MKPDAPVEIRGPFKPIKTNVPGIEISEIFPQHAQHADKFSLVRSCYHTAAAVHDTGHQMMQTGRLFTGGINTPHAGCALSFLRGRRSDLPAHVILPEPMGPTGGNLPHGQDAGFLGKAYDPFVADGRSRRSRTSRFPICCRRRRSAKRGWSGAASCGRSSTRRSTISRPATTPSCWTATSRRPSA